MTNVPNDPRAAGALRRAERLARVMDDAVTLPGTNFRVGLDGVTGLVPVAGDSLTLATNAYILYLDRSASVSRGVLVKMLVTAGFDFAIGSIPLIGDFFDFAFKSHCRNVNLLRRELTKHAAGSIRSRSAA